MDFVTVGVLGENEDPNFVFSVVNQNTTTANIIWTDKSTLSGFEYGDYILTANERNPHFQLAAQIRSKHLLINHKWAKAEVPIISRSLYTNLDFSESGNLILFNKNKFSVCIFCYKSNV